MGEPAKIMLLQEVLSTIRRDNLLSVVQATGDVLYKGLRALEKEFPALLSAARGRGTFLAIDCATSKLRDDLVSALRAKGECNIVLTSSKSERLEFPPLAVHLSFAKPGDQVIIAAEK